MNQLLLNLAAAALAAAAFPATAAHAAPDLLADRHADSRAMGHVGAAIQPCLASEMDVPPPDRTGADDALVWLLLTGGAALLAFARRGRTGMPRS